MTHRLTNNCAKNYCNRTLIVKVIVEDVVTCFFGTRCISCLICMRYLHSSRIFAKELWIDIILQNLGPVEHVERTITLSVRYPRSVIEYDKISE